VAHQVCVLSKKYSCFGLTGSARVGLVAILSGASNNYLAIGGGDLGEIFNKTLINLKKA
jgi:hypothetical protein